METIINFLRTCKILLTQISSFQIFGFHIDLFLHFIVSFILILILLTRLTLKKSIIIVVALMFLKELVDIFAKSHLEYIRPPTIDFILDILSGILGIGLAIYIHRRKIKNSRYHDPII